MVTQYEAIIEAFENLGGERTRGEIEDWATKKYGSRWKDFGTPMADMVPISLDGNTSSLVREEWRVLRRTSRGRYCLARATSDRQKTQEERKRTQKEHHKEQGKEQSGANASTGLDDLFSILELPKNATRDQVKDAFLKLSQEWHPDKFEKHQDPRVLSMANEKYIKIKDAYEQINRIKGWT